ncbi:ficolin-2-like [Patiria miniata]|uniref:Fibrinogen C-terminal domain-containing protein n=1 Tax=Patiria miniata TaxID=46514 RepID=A0A914BTU0_PATMI|nr:ficolin-2-like [Patiria miniata]
MSPQCLKTFLLLAVLCITTTISQNERGNGSETHETSTSRDSLGRPDDARGPRTLVPGETEDTSQSGAPVTGGGRHQSRTTSRTGTGMDAHPPGTEDQDRPATPSARTDADVPPGNFVCQPHITIHPPAASSTNSGTCCNCSAIREMITSELARLRDSCRESLGRGDTGHQLQQLHTAVSDLAVVLKAFQRPGVPVPATLVGLPKDCSEALARGATNSGVYMVQPLDFSRAFEVYCDMETDGGGWTVFQRRQDGTVDFDRNFANYRRGFGDPESEFWLGNDNLHRLTAQDEYEFRVDLTDFEGNSAYAEYDLFRVGDAEGNFRLTVGAYLGTAGDAMANHNNQPFTTKDRDNDNWGTKNCAKEYHSAWWHNSCYYASLNGDYLGGTTDSYGKGVVWYQWKGYYYSLKTSEMKFRMKN